MDITLTLGETCMLLIAIALFILLLYCISLIRNLIPSIKSLSKVMKDVETITECASKSTQSAEAVVSDVMDITSSLVSSVKERTGLLGQISSIAMAVKAILSILSDRNPDSQANESCPAADKPDTSCCRENNAEEKKE